MTAFFATPDETREWLREEVDRLALVLTDEELPGGSRRCFLWPLAEPQLSEPVPGVQVWFPSATSTVLTQGTIDWKASAFYEHTAAVGQRTARSLVRSMRKRATVPLHAMSLDETVIASKPSAWGTLAAVNGPVRLRQFADAGCWFVTAGGSPDGSTGAA